LGAPEVETLLAGTGAISFEEVLARNLAEIIAVIPANAGVANNDGPQENDELGLFLDVVAGGEEISKTGNF
jgi:hypothetical protein